MDNLKLIYADLYCPDVSNSSSASDIEKDYFPIADRLCIETSCSNDSYDLLLSSNHEFSLEDISNSHMVQEKDNHANFFTSWEEINMKDIPILSQQCKFYLEEESNLE